jgi:molybdopterin-guanine dinucleotide biosynthesis protein A
MVVRVATAFESAGLLVTIVARDSRLLDYGFPILVEPESGPLHPLAGVVAALESLEEGESALFAPCDVPFISPAEVTSMAESVAPAIAVGIESDKTHPLIAHYNKSQLPQAREILEAEGPVGKFATEALLVPLPEASLSNVNYRS